MKKPLDKVYDAYYDELGTEFGEKVRKRIHWICSNALGSEILDVGCSQGITSIILGREGKKVLGIDLLSESIEYANSKLDLEEDDTRKHVEFQHGNFITFDFNGKTFDSILLTEVLEHLTQPMCFIEKAYKLLNTNGRLIITVPFGINDYFDHKKTYYLYDLLTEISPFAKIEKIEFFGKWIGIVGVKKEEIEFDVEIEIPNDLIKRMENTFYLIERELLNNVKRLQIDLSNEKNKTNSLIETVDNYEKQIKTVEKKNDELKISIEKAKQEISNLSKEKAELEISLLNKEKSELDNLKSKDKSDLEELKQEIELYKKELILEKKEKIKVKNDMLEILNKEEELLISYQQLIKKYETLKNSKLGRLTLAYWKKRRSLIGGRK